MWNLGTGVESRGRNDLNIRKETTKATGYKWAILFLDFPVDRNISIRKIFPVFTHHITQNAKSTGTGSVCCSMWITREC